MSEPQRNTGRSAFAYDFMMVRGGAEAVTLHVLASNPDLQLITGFSDKTLFPEWHSAEPPWHILGNKTDIPGWQGLQVMRAFSRSGSLLNDYDQVIFSGIYCPTGAVKRQEKENLYYCHTPPRFAFDLHEYYLRMAAPWQRPLLKVLAKHVRSKYAEAMSCMNRIAVNSRTVANRLERFLGITDVSIIHPPVNTGAYRFMGQKDYYLSNARLEPYKRVHWVIEAFKKMPDKQLVVASGGSQLDSLQSLAAGHGNIRFTGWCDESALSELLGHCIATVYVAKDEDFGMSPVESMAAGKPVIGVNEGGLSETVVDGRTGYLLPSDSNKEVDALIEAIESMNAETAQSMRSACEAQAGLFAAKEFDAKFNRFRSPDRVN